jgi:hypothetical protein
MKKSILILFIAISYFTFGQTAKKNMPPSILIIETKDKFTDGAQFNVNRNLIIKDKKVRFDIFPLIDKSYTTNFLICKYLNISVQGENKCSDGIDMILLLSNNEKVFLSSFDKFNCTGDHSFKLDSLRIDKLSRFPVTNIRITNAELTYQHDISVSESSQNYFIDVFRAIDLFNKTK